MCPTEAVFLFTVIKITNSCLGSNLGMVYGLILSAQYYATWQQTIVKLLIKKNINFFLDKVYRSWYYTVSSCLAYFRTFITKYNSYEIRTENYFLETRNTAVAYISNWLTFLAAEWDATYTTPASSLNNVPLRRR